MTFETITAPTSTAIDVDDAKVQLALAGNTFDEFIASLIQTATGVAETFLNGCILPTEKRFYCRRLTDPVRIPHGLVSDVSKVEYRTPDGVWHELDSAVWQYDILNGQAMVFPRDGQSFPCLTLHRYRPVRITFTTGFPEIPEPVKHALRLIVACLFENRESADELPAAAYHLLAPYRTVTQEMF